MTKSFKTLPLGPTAITYRNMVDLCLRSNHPHLTSKLANFTCHHMAESVQEFKSISFTLPNTLTTPLELNGFTCSHIADLIRAPHSYAHAHGLSSTFFSFKDLQIFQRYFQILKDQQNMEYQ